MTTRRTLLLKLAATGAALFAFLMIPIVLISMLARGALISVAEAVLLFAASLAAGLVLVGLIWAQGS